MVAEEKAPRAANIFDVARLAGVSHQTVSRVLNGMPNVRPATKERVEQAIAQLRYSPSPAARALVTRRTRTIGLIAPSVPDHGPAAIAMHVNITARQARYNVETVSAPANDPAAVRAAMEALMRQRVDAIVLVIVDLGVLEMIRGLDVSIPVVASVSTARRSPRMVSIDQYRGARAAVRHLVDLGHTRILHLAGPAQAPDALERIRGWRDELAASQLAVVDPVHGDWTPESGYRLTSQLDLEPGMALFVSNDLMALGALSALRERGLDVPRDVSIVGFDDIPESAYFYPPLTTVRQDFAVLGSMLMQRVLVALEESDLETADSPLPTQLVVRQSSGPAAS